MTSPRHRIAIILSCISIIIQTGMVSAQPSPQPTIPTAPSALGPQEQRPPDLPGPGWGRGADSLEIVLAEIQVRQSTLVLSESSIWSRLVPRITLSAGFGMSDVAFIDPLSSTTSVLPRDSYRLTLSLSLNDILDFGRKASARVGLDESITRLKQLHSRQAAARSAEHRRMTALIDEIRSLRDELVLVQQLVRYYELQFEQGEIRFDTLLRARLQLLNTKSSVLRLEHALRNYEEAPAP